MPRSGPSGFPFLVCLDLSFSFTNLFSRRVLSCIVKFVRWNFVQLRFLVKQGARSRALNCCVNGVVNWGSGSRMAAARGKGGPGSRVSMGSAAGRCLSPQLLSAGCFWGGFVSSRFDRANGVENAGGGAWARKAEHDRQQLKCNITLV